MPAPVWPVDLPPRFLQEGFTYKPGDVRREMKTDAGARRLDRQSTGASGEMSGQLQLSPSGYALLDLFFADTTANGILDFDMPNQIDLTGDDVRCRFIGRPGVDRVLGPDLWLIGVRLEVLP